jgi:hypothetical protein
MFALLGAALLSVAGQFLIRALVGAAIGFGTFKLVIEPVKALIQARFDAAGDLTAYIGWLGIDVAVTIILSAWIGRVVVSSAKAFFVKKG